MKKLSLTWKKIISTILGFLGIGTLVSCYGTPYGLGGAYIYGDVYGDVDGNPETPDEPVPDIEVYVNDKYQCTTNLEGRFGFFVNYEGSYKVSFVDADEAENGSFETKIIPPVDTSENKSDRDEIDLGDITLEKK